jgi:hypothetical protein
MTSIELKFFASCIDGNEIYIAGFEDFELDISALI